MLSCPAPTGHFLFTGETVSTEVVDGDELFLVPCSEIHLRYSADAKRLSIVTLAETMPECEFGFTP